MAMIRVNDANFYYEIHGKGHPVILIAGYTCDYLSWQPVCDRLSKHFQVMVFDNRAIGRTTDDHVPLSVELMAQDVMALADQLHLEKPHIVGQSMGGSIAQIIASNSANKMGKLALLTTSAKWRKAMLDGLKSLLLMREKNVDFDLIFTASLPWIFGESFLCNEQQIATLKKSILENPYPQSVIDQARQFAVLEAFDGTTQLKNITSPTWIAYGKQDLVSLPYEARYLASRIPISQLVEFDCAHGIVLEQPQLLSEALKNFLQ